jgi:hypothetical protein
MIKNATEDPIHGMGPHEILGVTWLRESIDPILHSRPPVGRWPAVVERFAIEPAAEEVGFQFEN